MGMAKTAKVIHTYIKFPVCSTFSRELCKRYCNERNKEYRGKYEICHIHQRNVVSLIKFLRYLAEIGFYVSRLGNVCV